MTTRKHEAAALKATGRAAVFVLLASTACGKAAPPTGPLQPEAAASATYHLTGVVSGEITLQKGEWSDPDGHSTVTLGEPMATLDLDRDGDDDMAVVLASSGGGSGVFYELAALLNEGGRPSHAASASLGDRVMVESLTGQPGEVQVNMVAHDEDDPACCPSMPVVKTFRFVAKSFVEMPAKTGG